MLQPAFSRLVTRPPFPLSCLRMLCENYCTRVKFPAAMLVRFLYRSSSKVMSSTQCSEFSTLQQLPMYWTNPAFLSLLLIYHLVSDTSTLEIAFQRV